MNIQIATKCLLGLALITSVHAAWAHSFNILLIAPLSEPTGQSLLRGFLLATREQDGHEAEESDGHLGGLDSYIIRLDNMPEEPDRLESILRKSTPLFATGLEITNTTSAILEQNSVVVVDLDSSALWSNISLSPEKIAMMDGTSFSNAFRRRYGLHPDKNAIRGYLAARIIATTVRQAEEQSGFDPGKLKESVKQHLQNADW